MVKESTMLGNGAHISEDGLYRYSLYRTWSEYYPPLLFVMLNPSTADAHTDDPTIRRCMGFAKSWDYGGIEILNLFAFRATDPKALRTAADPVGPKNDNVFADYLSEPRRVVCAWGVHGTYRKRDQEVLNFIRAQGSEPVAIAFTKDGIPKHPLYLRADLMPQPFDS